MPSRLHLALPWLLACHVAFAGPVAESWHLPASTDERLGIRPQLMKCLASDRGQTVAGRRECHAEEGVFQDVRLNRAYRAALARLEPQARLTLQESQRGWLKMMPAQCELEAGYPGGGTDALEVHDQCVVQWRAYRVRFLESLGR